MLKNTALYFLPTFITGILSTIIMVPYTTYYLGPEEFGVMALLTSLASPLGPLSTTGFSWVVAGNYFKVSKEDQKILLFNLFGVEFLSKIVWVSLFWFSAPIIMPLFMKEIRPEYYFYFKLVLIESLLSSIWPSVAYLMTIKQHPKLHGFFELIFWAVSAITTFICFHFFGLKTATLFIAPLASAAISFLMCFVYVYKYLTPRWSLHWIKDSFKTGFPAIPVSLFELLSFMADRIFIQWWISLKDLGIYGHSFSYRNILLKLTKASSKSMSPILLEAFSKKNDLKDVQKNFDFFYALLALIGFGMAFFAKDIISILTHDKFTAATPLVQAWFFITLTMSFGMPYKEYLLIQKKNSFFAYFGVINGVVFILISAFFIYFFGIIGAVIAKLLLNLSQHLAHYFYAKKHGCPYKINPHIMVAALSVLVLMIGTHLFEISFFFRIIAFLCLSAIVLFKFKHMLNKVIKFKSL